MTSASTPPSAGLRVIVECPALSQTRFERRVRTVLATLPAGAEVIATTPQPRRLAPAVARAVTVVVAKDGAAALVAEHGDLPVPLVVVPASAQVSGDWVSEVLRRLADHPDQAGVLAVGAGELLAVPASAPARTAERRIWPPVQGVSARSSAPTAEVSIGAVLIVKDEELKLGRSLASLHGVVDEVVVYDTGSTDGTLRVAREHGAVVVEGYWDDDFGAARNRALAHSTTDWVLSVDADEVLVTEADGLRAWLDGATGDLALVNIVSTTTEGGSDGDVNTGSRLFRRRGAVWSGVLHEQVVSEAGGGPLELCRSLPPLHLLHSGYTTGNDRAAEKAERNLRISEAALQRVAQDDARWPGLVVDHARSLALSGRFDEAVASFQLVARRDMSASHVVQAARSAVPHLMTPEHVDDAELWTRRADAAGEARGLTAVRDALVRGVRGDLAGAVTDLEGLVEAGGGGVDLWGKAFDEVIAVRTLAQLLSGTGRVQRAADLMTGLAERAPARVPLQELLTMVKTASGRLDRLAERAPAALVERSLTETVAAAPALALEWLTALADAHPADVRLLAAGSLTASRTSIDAALEWAVRSREAGAGQQVCALRWLAEEESAHPRTRTLAWALLVHGLGQTGDAALLDGSADRLSGEDTTAVLDALRRLLPEVPSLRSAADAVPSAS